MTFATWLTKVRHRSEHFDERTWMCSHQAPPSERVVMHVGDAGQTKSHLEHNPLSLLGACYAIPGRKLNDPALEQRIMLGERALSYAIHQYLVHYPAERNHQGLDNQ